MGSATAIRIAVPADAARVGEVVAEAFHDDPITQWVVPVESDRPGVLPGYFGGASAAAVEDGAVYVLGDFDAVAVWFDATTPAIPPPPEPDPDMAEVCGPYTSNFHLLEKLMHAAQPQEPAHHHLAFLAVRGGLRRNGLGSRLLDLHHSRLDADGLGGYLDASNVASRRLYLRHGYQDLGDPFHPPGGPPMWPMWRPPQ